MAGQQPVTPTKVCREPGCPNLEPCDTHPRKAWGNGATSRARRGITKSGWAEQAENKTILRRNPKCYLCGAKAEQVDHVVPVFEGGSDTKDNKAPICVPCHSDKTKAEQVRSRQAAR